MDSTLLLEYATTSKAKCKKCKYTLEKDKLRVKQFYTLGNAEMSRHLCLECLNITKSLKEVNPEKIPGFSELSQEDQARALDHFNKGGNTNVQSDSRSEGDEKSDSENAPLRLKSGNQRHQNKNSKGINDDYSKSDGSDFNEAADEDEFQGNSQDNEKIGQKTPEIVVTGPRRITRSQTRDLEPLKKQEILQEIPRNVNIDGSSSSSSDNEEDVTKSSKPRTARKNSKDDTLDDQEEETKPQKSKAKKQPKSNLKQKVSFYTQEEEKQFEKNCEKIQHHSIPILKKMLRINMMLTSGNKPELIGRIADGMLLGAIPQCPKCAGGRLRFENQVGIYRCPGYLDDDEFKFCNKKFEFDEIERTKWKEISEADENQEGEDD